MMDAVEILTDSLLMKNGRDPSAWKNEHLLRGSEPELMLWETQFTDQDLHVICANS